MNVQVGQPAPQFEGDAYVRGEYDPRRLALQDLRGKWVVLFFYPRDFTFICPTEIRAFAELQPEFEQEGAVVVGASTDSFYSHKAWFEGDPRLSDVGYPVLADTNHDLSRSYGVLCDDGSALRATFIVDPQGLVRHIDVTELSVGRNVEETLRVLQALQTGELCPAGWRPGQPTLAAVPSQ